MRGRSATRHARDRVGRLARAGLRAKADRARARLDRRALGGRGPSGVGASLEYCGGRSRCARVSNGARRADLTRRRRRTRQTSRESRPSSRAGSREATSVIGKRSRTGTILAAAVLIAAGFTVAIVELPRLPKGTIWIVVAVAVGALAVIRAATR